ncbi:relaxase MobL, partial [Staphylococcus epidermidis]|uniref:relaxase MobL n=1 Tax=Staphylococcus epidermidis TaxID=1282 RepID=UPI0037493954
MSEQTSPAINLISDFKVGSSKGESYKKFINYISKEKNKKDVKKPDIKDNLFDKYLDYMSIDKLKKKQGYNKENVKKRTTMSFNSEHEFIEEKEMNRLKDKFQKAKKKNNVMYKEVLLLK